MRRWSAFWKATASPLPGRLGASERLGVTPSGEERDLRVGRRGAHVGNELDAVAIGQRHVEQDHVGSSVASEAALQRQRVGGVAGRAELGDATVDGAGPSATSGR